MTRAFHQAADDAATNSNRDPLGYRRLDVVLHAWEESARPVDSPETDTLEDAEDTTRSVSEHPERTLINGADAHPRPPARWPSPCAIIEVWNDSSEPDAALSR